MDEKEAAVILFARAWAVAHKEWMQAPGNSEEELASEEVLLTEQIRLRKALELACHELIKGES